MVEEGEWVRTAVVAVVSQAATEGLGQTVVEGVVALSEVEGVEAGMLAANLEAEGHFVHIGRVIEAIFLPISIDEEVVAGLSTITITIRVTKIICTGTMAVVA